jgi:hypothetical protein
MAATEKKEVPVINSVCQSSCDRDELEKNVEYHNFYGTDRTYLLCLKIYKWLYVSGIQRLFQRGAAVSTTL